ncbi:MAG TPA: uroporphyrinogen decarboxylase family protein [Planctomycetota bacterium]|nr:uroporphyrinogen decarboxylase family protein [Planctomycetota bacterium]
MSHSDGWAALNLEMPPRVPRTEYSAHGHWDLVRAATGIEVGVESPKEVQRRAGQAFLRAWNYDFWWSTLIAGQVLKKMHTDMGHAAYAAGGVDRSDHIVCPFKEPEEVLAFDPWQVYGPVDKAEWTRKFEEHYRANCDFGPDLVNMTGIYTTCVSGLIDIFGWEMLLTAAGTDPDGFGAVADRYASWIMQFFEALGAADVPAVMIHDDIVWTSGAIFPPEWYRRYVFPNYKKYFRPILDSGKRLVYTSDGNYTEFIDDIAGCGVHGFVMEPTTDMKYVAEKYGRTHAFIGNADTRILLSGTKPEIRAEVERCMAIGKSCPGFFMAVGNHIPANTPVDNALYYNQVYEELSRR